MKRKQVEAISHALADETRLRIFSAIAGCEELKCGDLVSAQKVTPATISHHLKILAEAGLIETRKEGQYVFNRARPEVLQAYTQALLQLIPSK